ncbi:unnamed protein product [Fusarium fujikuroi]|uniref:Uncharacterized protein n=1 Tax=Fusarium fujikuroi TaxID=5127 RepID=A0A9Q9RXL4_FUSFU|nr:unnamed protein product [Fusarium fujikuroi]
MSSYRDHPAYRAYLNNGNRPDDRLLPPVLKNTTHAFSNTGSLRNHYREQHDQILEIRRGGGNKRQLQDDLVRWYSLFAGRISHNWSPRKAKERGFSPELGPRPSIQSLLPTGPPTPLYGPRALYDSSTNWEGIPDLEPSAAESIAAPESAAAPESIAAPESAAAPDPPPTSRRLRRFKSEAMSRYTSPSELRAARREKQKATRTPKNTSHGSGSLVRSGSGSGYLPTPQSKDSIAGPSKLPDERSRVSKKSKEGERRISGGSNLNPTANKNRQPEILGAVSKGSIRFNSRGTKLPEKRDKNARSGDSSLFRAASATSGVIGRSAPKVSPDATRAISSEGEFSDLDMGDLDEVDLQQLESQVLGQASVVGEDDGPLTQHINSMEKEINKRLDKLESFAINTNALAKNAREEFYKDTVVLRLRGLAHQVTLFEIQSLNQATIAQILTEVQATNACMDGMKTRMDEMSNIISQRKLGNVLAGLSSGLLHAASATSAIVGRSAPKVSPDAVVTHALSSEDEFPGLDIRELDGVDFQQLNIHVLGKASVVGEDDGPPFCESEVI